MYGKDIEALQNAEYKNGTVYGEGALRSMVNSCLIYGTPKKGFDERYAPPYIESLGQKAVDDIWNSQERFFKTHCSVKRDVYTDSEGCTYSSLVEDQELMKSLEEAGFETEDTASGIRLLDKASGKTADFKDSAEIEDISELLIDDQKEKVYEAMAAAGYYVDRLESGNGRYVYNYEMETFPMEFESLDKNIEWLNGVCFDDYTIQRAVDKIMKTPLSEEFKDSKEAKYKTDIERD